MKSRMQELFDSNLKSDDVINILRKEFKKTHEVMLQLWYDTFSVEERRSRQKRLLRNKNLGENNPIWNGGKHVDVNGYVQIIRPDWYVGSTSSYAKEHVIVYCAAFGLTSIPKGFVVHHKDFNKLNNDLSNLVLLSDYVHGKIHNAADAKG